MSCNELHGNQFVVVTAAMLSYRKDKYGGKTELEVLTVLYTHVLILGVKFRCYTII